MTEKIIFAGFGGQGVMLAGKLMCIAGMREGKYVSHIPSYGAEMRGGTANCQVIISDEDIASPVVFHPDIAVVLNTPSLIKFEDRVKPGGLLIYNSSLIDVKPKRTDIKVVDIAANDIADSQGSKRSANMAAIGKLLAEKPELAQLETVISALDEAISERNKKFNPINEKVLKAGFAA
ncbi:MAG TPA: 2-oxoacid:ferredoxin oxidoreductase subunit gamma [Sediminispirochaeta sp.]|nr:2-oxoacid:ferredoxin oxidoreductase subunit gamma [Sediminispirochaeta sp.]